MIGRPRRRSEVARVPAVLSQGGIIELDSEMIPISMNPKKNRKKNNGTGGAQKKGKGGRTKRGRMSQP